MMESTLKRTWAEIDLDALACNYEILCGRMGPSSRFLGVVKADAYGHGAVQVSRTLEELGAAYLAVSSIDEAREIRSAGIRLPILQLGLTPAEQAGQLLAHRVAQAVWSEESALSFSREAERLGGRIKVHIKLDTGMSRLGFLCDGAHLERAMEEIAAAAALPGLEAEGIFTHFAAADGDEDYTMGQFTRFLDLVDGLKERGVEFALRHCANSAAVLSYPCTHLDMVRPGIALYGHYPDPACEGLDRPGLAPVMRLFTRVAAVRTLPGGTCVSYGCTARLEEERTLAVLPLGYADGLSLLSNRGGVWLGGQRCPIVGRVCMDMCMVDVTGLAVRPGDVAEVFGTQAPIEEAAGLVGTIQYELLCSVSPRVPRIYRR